MVVYVENTENRILRLMTFETETFSFDVISVKSILHWFEKPTYVDNIRPSFE